jgi:hypothetical protein
VSEACRGIHLASQLSGTVCIMFTLVIVSVYLHSARVFLAPKGRTPHVWKGNKQLTYLLCHVTKRREQGDKSKQETEKHTQGADPATQADTDHSKGRKKQRCSTNQLEQRKATTTHSPIQNKPPAQTPNGNPRQRHKTTEQAGQKKGRRAQARHGGAGQTTAPKLAKPQQREGTRPTSAEGGRATGHRNE